MLLFLVWPLPYRDWLVLSLSLHTQHELLYLYLSKRKKKSTVIVALKFTICNLFFSFQPGDCVGVCIDDNNEVFIVEVVKEEDCDDWHDRSVGSSDHRARGYTNMKPQKTSQSDEMPYIDIVGQGEGRRDGREEKARNGADCKSYVNTQCSSASLVGDNKYKAYIDVLPPLAAKTIDSGSDDDVGELNLPVSSHNAGFFSSALTFAFFTFGLPTNWRGKLTLPVLSF